jgi:8-oxo-dGTP diphosphatase
MAKKYAYDYPRPAVTVDVALVTRSKPYRVLLVRRKYPPFAGRWALPGGFIEMDETLEESVRREIKEETGLSLGRLEQLQTFGDPGRDPRGRVVSVVFLARTANDRLAARAGDDAAEVGWHLLGKPPALAFDHAKILQVVQRRLARRKKRAGPN